MLAVELFSLHTIFFVTRNTSGTLLICLVMLINILADANLAADRKYTLAFCCNMVCNYFLLDPNTMDTVEFYILW